jgi:hypothetical protein
VATGSATVTISVAAGTNYLAPTSQTVSVSVQFIPTVLDDATWEQIQQVAQAGTGANYWDVGDRKAVTLNGTVTPGRTLSNYTWYCFIIGFNHNAATEGEGTIHFQFGFNALTDGVRTALTSNDGFIINSTGHSAGNYISSYMKRTTIPSFKDCLPLDLKSVLKTIKKYVLANNYTYAVNYSQDEVFLLSRYEFSAVGPENINNTQAQYEYYALGNSKTAYDDRSTSNSKSWWTRSVVLTYNSTDTYIEYYTDDEGPQLCNSKLGLAPGFAVG